MDFLDKIRKIEALIASSKHEGEKLAAAHARARLLDSLHASKAAKPIEYTAPLGNPWRKRLFIALCSKYEIRTYRYKRQKHTTAMFRATPDFVETILMPEFKKYSVMLEELVEEIINGLISQIHDVKEEEMVIVGELSADL